MRIETKVKNAKSREHVLRTAKNKIRRIAKELQRNPNNTKARQSLEFWKKI